MKILRDLFERVRRANLKIKPSKTKFCYPEVEFLGHCYEIQYTWTARSTETETETGLDRYVMLGARWLTEY